MTFLLCDVVNAKIVQTFSLYLRGERGFNKSEASPRERAQVPFADGNGHNMAKSGEGMGRGGAQFLQQRRK